MKSKKGFSLIELLIVIGIIAVLGGVMLTQFSGSTESALAASCMNNMRTLSNAVLADASKRHYYPAAGAFQYKDRSGARMVDFWGQGWIGHKPLSENSCSPVSCYHERGDLGLDQYSAITNGTIWRQMGGNQSSYVCPKHMNHSKSGNNPEPSWSYVMNSYFGWDRTIWMSYHNAVRTYGTGYFEFRYGGEFDKRRRSPEKVLLFAELPYVEIEGGVQEPQWMTSPDTSNDSVLQYEAESDEKDVVNKAADGAGESIGFNHKVGDDYCAHVAFADGHCERLIMPREAKSQDLIELTTWLCTGQEYTFNGARYEKASQ